MEKGLNTNLDYWYETTQMPAGKRKVLTSAIKLFSTQGYDKTSTLAIAQDAQVSQAVIFKYFHSKEELLQSILQPIIANLIPVYADQFLHEMKETRFTPEQAEEGIYYLIRERFNFLYQNKELVIIIMTQALVDDEIKNSIFKAFSKQQDQLMRLMWLKYKDLTGRNKRAGFHNFVELIVTQVISYFIQVVKIAPHQKYNFEKDLRRFARNVYLTL